MILRASARDADAFSVDDTDAGKQSPVYRLLPDTVRSTTVRGVALR
jgi:hypothetical protein